MPLLAPPPTRGPAFDRAAAAATLMAVNVQVCKRQLSGTGHVTVTFATDGSVTGAVVDSGPFTGTLEGACVATRFRGARVTPFAGPPVRVGRSFTLR